MFILTSRVSPAVKICAKIANVRSGRFGSRGAGPLLQSKFNPLFGVRSIAAVSSLSAITSRTSWRIHVKTASARTGVIPLAVSALLGGIIERRRSAPHCLRTQMESEVSRDN